MKFNIIGFGNNFSNIQPDKWKHCIVHPGTRLISKLDEPGVLMCPLCGTPYAPKDTISDENFEPTSGPSNKTKIITAKKKKKQYDSEGHEINDEQLLKDIARGVRVIKYTEIKSGEGITIGTRNRRVIRARKDKETE
jgi:hypothetical protein